MLIATIAAVCFAAPAANPETAANHNGRQLLMSANGASLLTLGFGLLLFGLPPLPGLQIPAVAPSF